MGTFTLSTTSHGGSDTGGSYSIGTINVPAGALIVVGTRWEGGNNTATISDTAGNSYTNVGYKICESDGEDEQVGLWYTLSSGANAANEVMVTTAATDYRYGHTAVFTYSGTIDQIDAFVSNEALSDLGTFPFTSSGSLTTDSDGLTVAIVGVYNGGRTPVSWDDSFLNLSTESYSEMGYKIGSHSGVVSGELAQQDTYAIIACNFENAAGGALPLIMQQM